MKLPKEEIYENLSTINRSAIFIEPKTAFLEWAREFPDDYLKLTVDELHKDNTTYLIPEQEAEPDIWLRRNFTKIFENELYGWCTDPSLWPKDRSFKAFKNFFRVYFSSVVIDLGKGGIFKD
jgi:hypothetical protein